MFCAPELQILISGSQAGIDLGLPANQAMRLASCERSPSLGFAGLHPPFTVQRVDCSDDSRLPTASTCFNVLKLPTYSSQKVLRGKLLLSIRSKAGFDLS